MDPKKRSQIVVLTLLGLPMGAIALADAFPGHQMKRNLYPDQASCERDYSKQQCQPDSRSSSSSSSSPYARIGGWHGPYYYADRGTSYARSDPGIGRTGQVTPTQVSVRGGFGSFGRASAAGRGS